MIIKLKIARQTLVLIFALMWGLCLIIDRGSRLGVGAFVLI